MKTLPSGLNEWEGTDNVMRVNENDQWHTIDAAIRPYKQVVDTSTYNATIDAYTTISYLRQEDGTLYMKAVLSNPDANGYMQTDTWTFYAADGTTVVKKRTWTLAYDANGIITNKTYVDS